MTLWFQDPVNGALRCIAARRAQRYLDACGCYSSLVNDPLANLRKANATVLYLWQHKSHFPSFSSKAVSFSCGESCTHCTAEEAWCIRAYVRLTCRTVRRSDKISDKHTVHRDIHVRACCINLKRFGPGPYRGRHSVRGMPMALSPGSTQSDRAFRSIAPPSLSLTCRHMSATAAPSIGSEFISLKLFLAGMTPTGFSNIGVIGGSRDRSFSGSLSDVVHVRVCDRWREAMWELRDCTKKLDRLDGRGRPAEVF